MKKEVFKKYDIRGKWPNEINENFVKEFAGAFLRYLNREVFRQTQSKILISRDREEVSKKAYEILKKELVKLGGEVIDGREMMISAHNFVSGTQKTDGAVMVTASHLPKNYTGFKLSKNGTEPVKPEEILKFWGNKEIDSCHVYRQADSEYKKGDYLKEYIDFLVEGVKLKKEWRVAIDVAGGVAEKVFNEVLKKFKKIKVEKICFGKCEHGDGPLEKKNWKEIKKIVLKKKLDLGIMVDGDGDRIVFFDEEGKFIEPSSTLAVLASEMKLNGFVGNVNIGMAVREETNKFFETKTGHIYIREEMRKRGAEIGGEHSGHIYFKRNFYAEDPIYAFLKMLEILEKKGEKLSEAVLESDPYFKSGEINFKMTDKRFGEIKEEIKKQSKKPFDLAQGKILEIDGVKISGKDWWMSLRKSHTEDLVRLNVEAKEKKELEKIVKEVRKLIR